MAYPLTENFTPGQRSDRASRIVLVYLFGGSGTYRSNRLARWTT